MLTISGHDPTGGAGIQADIEVIHSLGCHPCSIISCLTVQDSSTVHRLMPLNADDLVEQASVLFEDMPIVAIKIGLTGSVACVDAIAHILQQQPTIPVVLDPVLASGDGTPLASSQLINAIKNALLPLTTVLTPNSLEARQLTGLAINSPIDEVGLALLDLGVSYALITGGHETGATTISNRLFQRNIPIEVSKWPRRAGEFHGSGCTLASAIAAFIAKGEPITNAIEQAQRYTDGAIKEALKLGKGQLFPNRFSE
ncbi:MAG: hydroxymethylpyrimidine/phosphomethylpyrimidine kinase [Cycloclasticus sp.]|nr:hydroxymethylpyrimidine/phosphomethylpyrimidine kinase [Cycloclasticus sp.]